MAGTVITNKGVALIAKLLASGQELIFTRAAVGTGRLPGGFSPQNMTGLVKYKKDGDIAACSSSGDIASVIFQISSIGVTEGFTVTEVGLFATDPDDGEILYSYMDLSEDPQYIYAEGGAVSKFAEIELQTVIGQLEKVTAYINPGSLLTNDGDISNTEIGALDVITESFPVPAAKEKSRKFFGKVKKSMEDWKNLKTGLITTGKLINNGLCTEAGFALDARFGKNLQDQITTQNNNLMGYAPSHTVSDCNDAGKNGVTFFVGGTAKNRPTTDGSWYYIRCYMYDAITMTQIAYKTNIPNQWIRVCANGVWTDWDRVTLNADLDSKIGTLGADSDAIKYMKYAWVNDHYTLVVHFKDGKERYLYFDA